MKCQSLFSGKNKKNIINLSSAELAQSVVMVNGQETVIGTILFQKLCANVVFECNMCLMVISPTYELSQVEFNKRKNHCTKTDCFNPCPAEPGYVLLLQTV